MSTLRDCSTYEVTATEWYLELDGAVYGPFTSEDDAIDFMNDNFSNPGGWLRIFSKNITTTKQELLRATAVKPQARRNYW